MGSLCKSVGQPALPANGFVLQNHVASGLIIPNGFVLQCGNGGFSANGFVL